MAISMKSAGSFSRVSLNQGQLHDFHFDPHVIQNSPPQRLLGHQLLIKAGAEARRATRKGPYQVM